jgi:hypothetical protein
LTGDDDGSSIVDSRASGINAGGSGRPKTAALALRATSGRLPGGRAVRQG